MKGNQQKPPMKERWRTVGRRRILLCKMSSWPSHRHTSRRSTISQPGRCTRWVFVPPEVEKARGTIFVSCHKFRYALATDFLQPVILWSKHSCIGSTEGKGKRVDTRRHHCENMVSHRLSCWMCYNVVSLKEIFHSVCPIVTLLSHAHPQPPSSYNLP